MPQCGPPAVRSSLTIQMLSFVHRLRALSKECITDLASFVAPYSVACWSRSWARSWSSASMVPFAQFSSFCSLPSISLIAKRVNLWRIFLMIWILRTWVSFSLSWNISLQSENGKSLLKVAMQSIYEMRYENEYFMTFSQKKFLLLHQLLGFWNMFLVNIMQPSEIPCIF